MSLVSQSPTFLAPETCFMEDSFSTGQGCVWGVCGGGGVSGGVGGGGGWGNEGRGWFKDGSSALRLFCTLFPLLLYQLHLRSSGIRSRKLGTPGLVTDMSLSKSDRALEISKQDLEMEPWKLGMKLEQVTEALC